MTMSFRLFLCTIGAILLGCSAATGQSPTETNGKICVYRLPALYGKLGNPKVFFDNKEVGKIRNGRYFSISVTPGHHTVTSTMKKSGVDLDVQPGETYYVKTSMTFGNGLTLNPAEVSLVPPEQGRFAVSNLKKAEKNDLKVDR